MGRGAGHLRVGRGVFCLLSQWRHSSLWRCGGAHQHRAARFGFAHSGIAAIGDGMAAVAAFADDAAGGVEVDVAVRSWGIAAFDGGLRVWSGGYFSAGAECTFWLRSVAVEYQRDCGICGRHLRVESEPALPAVDRHDRVALPRVVCVGGCVLCRFREGAAIERMGGSGEAVSLEVRAVPGGARVSRVTTDGSWRR